MTGAFQFEQFEPKHCLPGPRGRLLLDFLRPDPVEVEQSAPELPEIDAARDAIEAEIAAKQQAIDNINDLVARIEQTWESDVEELIRRFSKRTSESVATLLPNLLNEFGAGQIAAAVVAVVEKAGLQAPVLLLSPDEYDGVVAELVELGSPNRIELHKSASQPSGTASLNWDQGGADLDLNELLSVARETLGRDLPPMSQGADEQ